MPIFYFLVSILRIFIKIWHFQTVFRDFCPKNADF